GLPALVARLGGRWILEAAADAGDIAKPERLLTGAQAQLANVIDRPEPALHVDAHRPFSGFDAAGGVHGILASKRRLNIQHGQATSGQSRRGHLDEDARFLQPEKIDLGDTGEAQQNIARAFREGLELRVAEALAGHRVKGNVGVAELVVEEGPDYTLGQRLANVGDFLPRLIAGVLDRLPAHRTL